MSVKVSDDYNGPDDPRHALAALDEAWAAEQAKYAAGRYRADDQPAEPSAEVIDLVDRLAPPPEPEPEPIDEEAFWGSRTSLTTLRTYARARMASPWAVLGAVMARATCAVPPKITLPAIIGGEASLNLFVALVGRSGGGKGAAESVAAECVQFTEEQEVATLGSGEGIMHLYSEYGIDPDGVKGPIRLRDSVLFTAPEIDQLAALGSRQSSTLMPTLRSAWSGERIGFSYASREKKLPLEAHTYRLGLIVGVQPARAAALLDEAAGGTPQRFIWLSTEDPDATADLPEAPQPLDLRDFRWTGGPLNLPRVVWETVQTNRLAVLHGATEALDGHALLCREKVTVALMVIDGRQVATEEDWDLAGIVMAKSDQVRASVQKVLALASTAANVAEGTAMGERQDAASEKKLQIAVSRIRTKVVKRLSSGEVISHSSLRGRFHSRDRDAFDVAINQLVSENQVQVTEEMTDGDQIVRHYLLP